MVVMAVSVNGKFKTRIEVPVDSPNDQVLKIVDENETIKKSLEGKQIVKQIVVPNKIVNIVVK